MAERMRGHDDGAAADGAEPVSTTPAPAASVRNVAVWGVLSQVVSSGANFVFIVLTARTLDPDGFGSIALGFEVYLMTVIITRGVAGDTLTARFSGRSDAEVRGATRSSSGVAFSFATMAAVGVAVAAAFAQAPLRGVLLVAAIVLPVLVLQDFIRQAFIVQGRAKAACMNELLWAALQVPLLVAVIVLEPSAFMMYAAWALAGVVTAGVGIAKLGVGLLPGRGVRAWLRDHRTLWPYLLGENLVYALSSFVVVVTISGLTGLAGLAAFRAAMTVYAPLSTLGRGVIAVGVALLARRRSEPTWIGRSALMLSWTMAPVALLWGGLVVLLPDNFGEAAFGQTWEGAQPLVFLASFPCAIALFSVGASAGMRALDAGKHGFGARLAVSGIAFVAFVSGVAWDGVRGAFVVFAFSVPLQAAVWWRLLAGATRRAERLAAQSDETRSDGTRSDQASAST